MKATDALVSIVIPCYNSSAFLEDALRSALAQTHRDIEVIVVDDGSTDNSPEIARQFAVRYLREPNSGVSQARNLGMRESRGTYIVFLDADDRLRPEAVEVGLRVLAQRLEAAMAVGDHCFISEDGSFNGNSSKADLNTFGYQELLESNFIEMTSSVIFRRSVLFEVGGFDNDLHVAEDYELYLRIARAHPICRHSVVVAEYRKHKSNISHDSELMLTTTLRVLRRESQFVRNDSRSRRAFRKGIRTWQRQYGRQLAAELARSFPRLSFDDALRKCSMLAREYPQGLLAVMLLRMSDSLQKLGAARRHDPSARSPHPLLNFLRWVAMLGTLIFGNMTTWFFINQQCRVSVGFLVITILFGIVWRVATQRLTVPNDQFPPEPRK